MEYRCLECGKPFSAKPSKGSKYCSRTCYGQGKTRRDRTIRLCATCQKPYTPDRPERASRFCSRACQVESWRKPRPEVTCEYCGKRFTVVPSRIGRVRFCSHTCRAMVECVGKTIGVPKPGRKTPRRHYENWRYVKAATATRKRDNYTCQDCGKQYKPRQYGLDVHHIIPVRLGGTDTLDNLISLCRSCHSKRDNRVQNFGK